MSATLSITPLAGVADTYEVVIDCQHAETTADVIDPHRKLSQRDAVRLAVARHTSCRCTRELRRRLAREQH